MDEQTLLESLQEVDGLRNFAVNMITALDKIKNINESVLEISTQIVSLAPLGINHPEIHEPIESILESVKGIQKDIMGVIDNIDSVGDYFHNRLAIVKEEIENA